MQTQRKEERRKTIREALIFLRKKPFSLKACPEIMDLVMKADGLENVPAEQRKRLLRFHDEELKAKLSQETTLVDSVLAVEGYLDSLPREAPDEKPFAEFPPLTGWGGPDDKL